MRCEKADGIAVDMYPFVTRFRLRCQRGLGEALPRVHTEDQEGCEVVAKNICASSSSSETETSARRAL